MTPDKLPTSADKDDAQIPTLSYGLGNWCLIHGDQMQTRAWLERAVASGGWSTSK